MLAQSQPGKAEEHRLHVAAVVGTAEFKLPSMQQHDFWSEGAKKRVLSCNFLKSRASDAVVDKVRKRLNS